MVVQLDVDECARFDDPYFCQGLTMLEVQNNSICLRTVIFFPSLLALHAQPRASSTTAGATSRVVSG
jgi:hypothetical protein